MLTQEESLPDEQKSNLYSESSSFQASRAQSVALDLQPPMGTLRNANHHTLPQIYNSETLGVGPAICS